MPKALSTVHKCHKCFYLHILYYTFIYHVPEDKRPKTTDKVIIACGTIDKVKSTTAAPPKPTATTEKPKSSSTLTQAQGLISLMSIGLCFY